MKYRTGQRFRKTNPSRMTGVIGKYLGKRKYSWSPIELDTWIMKWDSGGGDTIWDSQSIDKELEIIGDIVQLDEDLFKL